MQTYLTNYPGILIVAIVLMMSSCVESPFYRFSKEARKDDAAIKARVKKPYPPDSDRVGQEDALYYNGDRYEEPAQGWAAAYKHYWGKD